jgi:PBSX family phage terminase large subunit
MPASVALRALPRQSELLDVLNRSDARLSVLYGGAMGGGKSHGIALAGFVLSHEWPGNRGFVGRLDFTDLRETTYQSCLDLWEATGLIAQHHKSEHWVRFKNGSRVLFGELKDAESWKSLNLGWFAIDEASEVPETSRLMMLSRLRLGLPGIRYREVLASNPGPGWVKRQFVDEPRPAGHHFVRSLPTDNAALPGDYVAELRKQFPDVWVKRYVAGSWDAFEGQVFDEFDRAVHVKPAIDWPEELPVKIRVIDHGLRNPTCCLWMAADADGVIHVFDEHYLAGQPVSVHAAAIKAKSRDLALPTLIDPSTQAVTDIRNGTPWSIRWEYALNGIEAELANNARMAGIIRVKELLRTRGLLIHENCVNLLRELPEYEWKDVEGDAAPKEDAEKKNDHAVDALRYGCVALFPFREEKPKQRAFRVTSG